MIKIEPLTITGAYMTYLFPFSFKEKERARLIEQLKKHQFTLFDLNNTDMEDLYYGEGVRISHEELDQFFLPFIEDKLFPHSIKDRGFIRYSKEMKENLLIKVHNSEMNLIINSVDIILCPFGIGIITIRMEMENEQETLSDILNMMSHFRVLEPKLEAEKGSKIYLRDKIFHTTSELIFNYLCKPLKPFVIENKKLEGYYGSLPFFEDERMLSSAILIAADNQIITNNHLFQMGQLDGKDKEGHEIISSNNSAYIDGYVKERLYDRWAPKNYTITSEHAQVTVTLEKNLHIEKNIAHFMSIHYYNLMLHYYYKIMLLKLSFEHSEVSWTKDQEYVAELMERISKFYSRYHFKSVSVRTEGKELTQVLRKVFNIDDLFEEVKSTVDDLSRAQNQQSDKRHNMLLFMLTIYTVISGIYGMNLVIEDWKGKTDWSKVPSYSFFEWISLITALTGIGLAGILLFTEGTKGARNKYRKWKRHT